MKTIVIAILGLALVASIASADEAQDTFNIPQWLDGVWCDAQNRCYEFDASTGNAAADWDGQGLDEWGFGQYVNDSSIPGSYVVLYETPGGYVVSITFTKETYRVALVTYVEHYAGSTRTYTATYTRG